MIAGKENNMIAVKTVACIHEIMAMSFTLPACLPGEFQGFFCFIYLENSTCLKDVMRY